MNICVYCASSDGLAAEYVALAEELGRRLGARGDTLIFGGGYIGLMGAVSRSAAAAGAHLVGVYPDYLTHLIEPVVHEKIVTHDLHERKAIMAARADAFIALPGGLGTLDEIFDILAPKSLKVHHKPVILLGPNGFYDTLSQFLDELIAKGFIKARHRDLWYLAPDLDAAFAYLDAQRP